MIRKKVLFLLGTRPEAIKLAPCIKAMASSQIFEVGVCTSGQHGRLTEDALEFFKIRHARLFLAFRKGRGVAGMLLEACGNFQKAIDEFGPDAVVVQGDTATTLCGALAALAKRKKLLYVESGLRTYDLFSPFPEEIIRLVVSRLSHAHFCPTKGNAENLKREGISRNVHVTGNTCIDSLCQAITFNKGRQGELEKKYRKLIFQKGMVLVTLHRREARGRPLVMLLESIGRLARKHPDLSFVFPMHPTPSVRAPAKVMLGGIRNVLLVPPIIYQDFVFLLGKCRFAVTDSGGMQEESPMLGKVCLVARDKTERTEAVGAGYAILVGKRGEHLQQEAEKLLGKDAGLKKRSLYGDGKSGERIARICTRLLRG